MTISLYSFGVLIKSYEVHGDAAAVYNALCDAWSWAEQENNHAHFVADPEAWPRTVCPPLLDKWEAIAYPTAQEA